jgi:uncharacterized membrane protein (DUF485 family)
MDDESEAHSPEEQTVPEQVMSGGPLGQHPTQPVPPYAAPFQATSTPQEMMGRIVLGFVLILLGWIMSSVYLSGLDGDAVSIVQTIGLIFRSIGLVIVAIAMLQGALLQNWYSERIRVGILVAVGLIVIGV